MAGIKQKPYYKPFKGILVPGMFKDENLHEVANYKPTKDDVFIVTYPKCGTTWMQIVALYIFRKGVELENYGDFGRLCPFTDREGLKSILDMPRPGVLKTHLPYHLMPYSSDAKYIFVLRNPKDTCVSFYYHTKSGQAFDFSEGLFDDFFELFMESQVEYGDYFDHLQSWWPHRGDRNLFHTTYEDMMGDLRGVVLRLAAFLGDEYIEAIEKDNGVLTNILKYSSFEHMKSMMAHNIDHRRHNARPRGDGSWSRDDQLQGQSNGGHGMTESSTTNCTKKYSVESSTKKGTMESSMVDGSEKDTMESSMVDGTKKDTMKSSMVDGTKKDTMESITMDGTKKDSMESSMVNGTKKDTMESSTTDGTKKDMMENSMVDGTKKDKMENNMADGTKKDTCFRTSHFRKGIVGDWRSHFSQEQSERVNRKFFERFGGTEIYQKYKPFL